MKKFLLSCLILLLPATDLLANCNLNRFRWECQLPLHAKHSQAHRAIVRCGASVGFMTQAEYAVLVRYQRANVGMALLINGEYVDSPCIPIDRSDHHHE